MLRGHPEVSILLRCQFAMSVGAAEQTRQYHGEHLTHTEQIINRLRPVQGTTAPGYMRA
jgi:hypothetical protein